MDELDDRDLAAALRRRADDLTATVVDTETAFGVVRGRSRRRRAWRVSAAGALAAAAVAIGVVAAASVVDDDEVVRTPATEPVVATRPATIVETTTAPNTTVARSTSVAPSTTVAQNTSVAPSTTVATTAPAATAARPADPSTTTYDSVGGSIIVALVDGVISLADDPRPAPGFSVRIDDDGPDRVRVRFERDDQRSEIRVDLEDGVLVPTITDD